ncbi:Gfo/Idh/MocA family oxidoreductase [Ktedonosporobacter rubrisoli]|uniref:Gfo/Idh/MocA family oxidoreductase n=1 Tax=Ktedonosporobacter rubrisoli TaxID=2509675 RepID=A0A4P6JY76_KTERU|nr:Gfo/Idh/MocA family oxidoreductase [Ktedonosporobacter rubrisoli]QBD80413.1 Gfo/Idh/MocA family oxidoreductase [Ktedonosporobacter rubrisoli]
MTVKIGLIGCGGIAEVHLRGYLQVEDARVTAVCDVVEEVARQRAEMAGGAQVFSTIQSLLAGSDVDAVDICLPHHLHKDAIVAAANAGKHILCEKPLCLTLEEAAAVQKAVSDNGVILMCAHNQLFKPAVQRARQLIEEGALGQVYELRTTDSFYHSFNMETIGWRGHREMIGGGELIDTGYHPSYLLLYLAGSEPVEVSAMLSNHRLHFMDGEDSAQVLVRFADGKVGNIVTSWAYEPTPNTEKFQVVAERGYIYSEAGGDLHYKIRGSEPVTIPLPKTSGFNEEIADFITCVREKRRPIHNEADGINVLKVILGAYQSVAEKRTIIL